MSQSFSLDIAKFLIDCNIVWIKLVKYAEPLANALFIVIVLRSTGMTFKQKGVEIK